MCKCLTPLQRMPLTYLCRNAAAMNFANQFLSNVKACACQYECFLFLVSFPFPSLLLSLSFSPSSFNRLHAYSLIDSLRKKWRVHTGQYFRYWQVVYPGSGLKKFLCMLRQLSNERTDQTPLRHTYELNRKLP